MAGQFFAMSGVWMRSVALSWLVFRMTHSAYWLGVATFCMQVPAFLFSPLAGAVADRFERRRILLTTQWLAMGTTLVLAALAFGDRFALWPVLTLSAWLGAINAFDITARHSISIDLVPREDLSGAISLNSMLMHGTRVVGPGMAGLLIGTVGEGWCFVICAASYTTTIFALSMLRSRMTHQKRGHGEDMLEAISGGLRYVASQPYIQRILIASTFVSLVTSSFTVLLPVFAKQVLGGESSLFAWLTAAAAAGSVIGAIVLGIRTPDISRLKHEVTFHIACYGAANVAFALSHAAWLSSTAAFMAGYHTMRLFPSLNNAVQQRVSDQMRGRVLSLFTMTFLGSMPLGSLATGWFSDRYGAPATLAAAGTIALLAAAWLAALRMLPRERRDASASCSGSRPHPTAMDLNLHRFEPEERVQDGQSRHQS